MRWRKEERERTRLEERVSKLPTADLNHWCDQALYSIGRNLSGFQRAPEQVELLEEARIGADALLVVLTEIKSRHSL
jgi:hypothetical protein